jgi:hypothetical protein
VFVRSGRVDKCDWIFCRRGRLKGAICPEQGEIFGSWLAGMNDLFDELFDVAKPAESGKTLEEVRKTLTAIRTLFRKHVFAFGYIRDCFCVRIGANKYTHAVLLLRGMT